MTKPICICPTNATDEACEVCIPNQNPPRGIYIIAVWEILEYVYKFPEANFISIRDSYPTEMDKKRYQTFDSLKLKNNLVLEMDDIVYETNNLLEEYPNIISPTKDHVQTLINWAQTKLENNQSFYIHCTAGISRSSACAIIVQALIDPKQILQILNPKIHYPNSKILDNAAEFLNIPNLSKIVQNFCLKEYFKDETNQ
jgi:predicted protein tyrosine phosphatase